MAEKILWRICPKCDGAGVWGDPQQSCETCDGDGQLNWGEVEGLADIAVKVNDCYDKLEDIWEKLNE